MTTYNITLETAQKNHPELVEKLQKEAVKKLKRSKAKNKGKDISELEWEYRTSTLVTNSGSLWNVLNAGFESLEPLQEKIDDQVSRTRVELRCSMNGAYAGASLDFVPEQVYNGIKSFWEQREKEQQWLKKLDEEEKRIGTEKLLEQLREGKGFFEIKI